jgi:hypothetical protein
MSGQPLLFIAQREPLSFGSSWRKRLPIGEVQSQRRMADPVTIPISIFDVTVKYQEPVVRLMSEAGRADVIQALFNGFAKLEPNADGLEIINSGKTTEQGIRLRFPSQMITMFFGVASCKFTKESAAWPEADAMLEILDTFLTTLAAKGGTSYGKKTSVLSLHIQLKTGSFKDVLRPFVDSRIKELDPAPLDAMAVVARWPGYRITLDGSAQLANGIFVQMEREFDASLSYADMKQRIWNDEAELLKLLGVQEVAP